MTFEIKKATRQGIKPLIGLYGESGTGKTYSALLLARGFVGPADRIVMVDTESGRGSLYADVIPGGYDVIELGEPFSPARYIEAIQAAERSGAKILVIDSASHSWEGIGGVLDMASANEEKSGKPGLHCWKQPKLEHAKMMLKLLQSPLPIIVCLRAKYKSRQTKDERGKTQIVKDEATSPIQAEDFIFEMTAHGEILQNHTIILTKCSHPALRDCFPKDKTEPIAIKHGEALAHWCNTPQGPGTNQSAVSTASRTAPVAQGSTPGAPAPSDEVKALNAHLWKILKPIHGDDRSERGKAKRDQWLVDEMILTPDETLSALTVERLGNVVQKTEAKLKQLQLV